MTDPASTDTQATTARWMRLVLSLLSLQKPGEAQSEMLTGWARHFSQLSPGATSEALRATRRSAMGVAISADRRRMTWSSAGPVGDTFPLVRSFLDMVGASDAARGALAAAGKALAPDFLGTWIEATPGGIDVGWFFLADHGLDQAAPHLPAGPALEGLLAFSEETEVGGCVRIGRSLGEPSFSEVQLVLHPAQGGRAQLANALCDALDLSRFAPDLLQLAEAAGDSTWLTTLWLTGSGVVKLGIDVPRPDTVTVLKALDQVGVRDDQALARLEGTLGGAGPECMELQQLDGATTVELQYGVSSSGAGG